MRRLDFRAMDLNDSELSVLLEEELAKEHADVRPKDEPSVGECWFHLNFLTVFPLKVLEFDHLTSLVLNCNFLQPSSFPDQLVETPIKHLYIEGCRLDEFPLVITRMTRLVSLFACGNLFSTIPPLTRLKRLENLWLSQGEEDHLYQPLIRSDGLPLLPPPLAVDFGDAEYQHDSKVRGGRAKIKAHVLRMEKFFSGGVCSAVIAFLCINRFPRKFEVNVVAMLPRALAAHLMEKYVWSTRFDALWSPCCLKLNPKLRDDVGKFKAGKGKNQRIKKKKEKKPGSGIKGPIM